MKRAKNQLTEGREQLRVWKSIRDDIWSWKVRRRVRLSMKPSKSKETAKEKGGNIEFQKKLKKK